MSEDMRFEFDYDTTMKTLAQEASNALMCIASIQEACGADWKVSPKAWIHGYTNEKILSLVEAEEMWDEIYSTFAVLAYSRRTQEQVREWLYNEMRYRRACLLENALRLYSHDFVEGEARMVEGPDRDDNLQTAEFYGRQCEHAARYLRVLEFVYAAYLDFLKKENGE